MQRVFVKEQRLLGGMQLMLRFLNALLRTNCHFGCSIWQARPSRLCRDQQSQTSNQHMTTPITSITSSTYFLPRIYYLPPTGSPLSEWEAHAKRCAALGFDHVLMPLPEQEEGLRAIARVCAKQKLRLLLDLDIGGGALQDRLANNHPEWFAYHDPDDDLPDPRRPAALGPSMRTLRYDDAAITASVADYWVAKVRSWITAGADRADRRPDRDRRTIPDDCLQAGLAMRRRRCRDPAAAAILALRRRARLHAGLLPVREAALTHDQNPAPRNALHALPIRKADFQSEAGNKFSAGNMLMR